MRSVPAGAVMTTPRQQPKAQAADAAARRTELARPAGRTAIGSKPVRITFSLNPGCTGSSPLDVPRGRFAVRVRARGSRRRASRSRGRPGDLRADATW
jgi:hypothetical protein